MADRKNIKDGGLQTLEAANAESAPSVTMFFCDSKGTLIDQLTDLKARASEPCGRNEDPCWHDIKQRKDGSAMFPVPAGQTVFVEAKGTIPGVEGATDKRVSFVPGLVNLCYGQTKNIKMFEAPAAAASPQADRVTLTITTHRCMNKDDHSERRGSARIVSATAEQIPYERSESHQAQGAITKKPASIAATILEHVAFFTLQKNTDYRFHMRLEEECAKTCPPFPFTWCADKDREISICVEPRERVVTLMFVDSCGKAVEPSEVLVDQGEGWRQQPKGQGGACTLTGVRAGRLRLLSDGYKFRPEEIHVDERMNQAHVLEATKIQTTIESGEVEEIFLEIAEEIGQGEQALFNILTLDRKLIKTLKAAGGKAVYRATADETCLIQAVVGGRVCGEQMHYSKLLGAGKT